MSKAAAPSAPQVQQKRDLVYHCQFTELENTTHEKTYQPTLSGPVLLVLGKGFWYRCTRFPT